MKSLHIFYVFASLAERLVLMAFVLMFAGFATSRALLSIGMATMGLAVVAQLHSSQFKVRVFHRWWWIFTFLFVSVATSGAWSSDKDWWWNFTRIHLPFLFLPVCCSFLHRITLRQLEWLLWLYVGIFSASCLIVLSNYFLHFNEINQAILRGGFVPVPISHIRYSLLLVMAFFGAIWLLLNGKISSPKIAMSLAVFLFISVHILSVRSAIFSLYIGGGVCLLFQASHLGWKKTVGVFLILFTTVILLFFTIPSLRNKIHYMRYDWMEFLQNKTLDASDGMRFRSWKAGWEVALKQPFYGAGYGDLYSEMQRWYTQHFPELLQEQKKLPHNQFLWWWVSLGWLGLLLSTACFIVPLWLRWKHSEWLTKVFYAVLFSSFLWEPTLEEQMGTGFCIVWLMLSFQPVYPNHDE